MSRSAIEPLERRLLLAYTRFAVIGDFSAGQPLLDVSNLIKSWRPNFIATVGDNNYEVGAASTIDTNVGQYFHDYIAPYTGSAGAGSAAGNRFFPALGNHDWGTPGAQPYLDYFTLPGNERYYNVVQGNVELFVLDSDPHEPDGYRANSVQARWLRQELADSTARWKIVLMHHAPYSSSANHGSEEASQWPFQEWGATAVIAGHDHTYERIDRNGMPYFVNGLGGRSLYSFAATPVAGSQARYAGDYGAMRIDAFDEQITFKFINRAGATIDTYTIPAPTTVRQTLVRAGDTWKYLDNGTNQGTAWRAIGFGDAGWASGPAQLGYGDLDESTTVSFGPSSSNRYITTYFRKTFDVANPAALASLDLRVLRDDGAVVYLNGNPTPIYRGNMPAGTITSTTLASSAVATEDENAFHSIAVSPALLVAGQNVLAVEIHQSAVNSSDLSFDLNLTATLAAPGALLPPAAPSALRATAASSTQINLAWLDTSTGETGFLIERSTDGGATFVAVAQVPAASQSFSATLLLPATAYTFRVRAFNDAGASQPTAPATATTSALPLARRGWSLFSSNRVPSLHALLADDKDLLAWR